MLTLSPFAVGFPAINSINNVFVQCHFLTSSRRHDTGLAMLTPTGGSTGGLTGGPTCYEKWTNFRLSRTGFLDVCASLVMCMPSPCQAHAKATTPDLEKSAEPQRTDNFKGRRQTRRWVSFQGPKSRARYLEKCRTVQEYAFWMGCVFSNFLRFALVAALPDHECHI